MVVLFFLFLGRGSEKAKAFQSSSARSCLFFLERDEEGDKELLFTHALEETARTGGVGREE